MQKYPSGRRGSPAKGVGGQKPREGSNPSHSAKTDTLWGIGFFPKKSYSFQDGELSERFKEPVLKTGDGATHREFESHTLRQIITATLIQVAVIFFLWYNEIKVVCKSEKTKHDKP